jgi:hypothetical protein
VFNIFMRYLPAHTGADTTQFADDVTNSSACMNRAEVLEKLTSSYVQTKEFCEDRSLAMNPCKTQFILFKSLAMKLPSDVSLTLDGALLHPEASVKLLGVILDRHFTFKEHITATTENCNRLLGVLARAATLAYQET